VITGIWREVSLTDNVPPGPSQLRSVPLLHPARRGTWDEPCYFMHIGEKGPLIVLFMSPEAIHMFQVRGFHVCALCLLRRLTCLGFFAMAVPCKCYCFGRNPTLGGRTIMHLSQNVIARSWSWWWSRTPCFDSPEHIIGPEINHASVVYCLK
jgi:hypothetical protein